jgi:hypothetical protein
MRRVQRGRNGNYIAESVSFSCPSIADEFLRLAFNGKCSPEVSEGLCRFLAKRPLPTTKGAPYVQKGLKEQRGSFLQAQNREGMCSRPRWLGTNSYKLENLSLRCFVMDVKALATTLQGCVTLDRAAFRVHGFDGLAVPSV